MRKYKALATVRLFTGSVVLDDAQAAARDGCLKKLKAGRFEVKSPVEFKAGEIIGLDGVPKPYRSILEEVKRAPAVGPAGEEK